jgi:hypothetical protein
MKRLMITFAAMLLLVSPAMGADLAVGLRYEPTTAALPTLGALSIAKMLRPVKIQPFSDNRSRGETFLGELRIDGRQQTIQSTTAVAPFATEAFRKVYGEWGGKESVDSPLFLKGEITQFSLEESEGYQAKVAFHFFLTEESGKILWDGHSSGLVKGSGRMLTLDSLPGVFSDILRDTYSELLNDEKLVGVWTGKVPSTYYIKVPATQTPLSAKSGR